MSSDPKIFARNNPEEPIVEEFIIVDGRRRSKVRYEMAKEWQERFWETRGQEAGHLDSLIITISSASLALSIGFLKDFVKPSHAAHLSLLIASWALFAACIISTLFSFWVSSRDLFVEANIYKEYLYPKDPIATDDELWSKCRGRPNRWTKWNTVCNVLSSLLFVAALITTILFVSINVISQQNTLPDQPAPIESQKPNEK